MSPKNKQTGLFIFCNACKSPTDGTCIKGGKCDPERQVYKIRVHVPGTKHGAKTKVLPVRDEKSAVKMAIEIYSDFKAQRSIDESSYYLFDYILRFLEFKKQPSKNRKPISDDTISDYALHLEHLTTAMMEAGYNPKAYEASILNDTVAKIAFEYLKEKYPSSVTHKKYFGTFQTFCNYLIKDEKVITSNPFSGWHFDKKVSNNEVIYENEFNKLFKVIDTKDRYMVEPSGIKRKMYYEWLKPALKLSLFTGGRRQEIPIVKWTDIYPNKSGGLAGGIILLRDIKNTRIQKLDYDKIKPIEINFDLEEFLIDNGYEFMKGQDKYIIDPSEEYTREFIKEYLSKSFAHYIKFASKRELSFKCLRKTWFTNCAKAVGDKNAAMLGGHSDKNVTLAHYINSMETAGTNMKFSRIFSENPLSVSALRSKKEGKNIEIKQGEVAQLVRAQDS